MPTHSQHNTDKRNLRPTCLQRAVQPKEEQKRSQTRQTAEVKYGNEGLNNFKGDHQPIPSVHDRRTAA